MLFNYATGLVAVADVIVVMRWGRAKFYSGTTSNQRKKIRFALDALGITIVTLIALSTLRPLLPKSGVWQYFHTSEELEIYRHDQAMDALINAVDIYKPNQSVSAVMSSDNSSQPHIMSKFHSCFEYRSRGGCKYSTR